MFDVFVTIAAGAIGYVMHLVKMPVAPLVFGSILRTPA